MSDRDRPEDRSDDVRRGRLLNDLIDARARGETGTEPELRAAGPELAAELREYVDLVGELRSASSGIEGLIAQGVLTRSDESRYAGELGPYKVLGLLGRGGMGIVLEAYEESLNRRVALKILRPDLAGDANALARFAREAKAAAALRHPNIVTVHAIGEERGVHYIAMEYVDGPTLADVIRNTSVAADVPSDEVASAPRGRRSHAATNAPPDEVASGLRTGRTVAADVPSAEPAAAAWQPTGPPLSTETIRHVFRQLLEALAAAHDAGLIHRDVKSSNILVETTGLRDSGIEGSRDQGIEKSKDRATDEPGRSHPEPRTPNPEPRVKLADFGLARMLSSQTRVTIGDSVLGTPEYMSPEQARGDEDIDHRSDLYSAGVVLYELLTGRTPFRADTPSAVIHQILNVEPADPRGLAPGVDPVLASLALRLMAKERGDRLGSAREAGLALRTKAPVASPVRRRQIAHRLGWSAAIVVALIGTVWGLAQFRQWIPVAEGALSFDEIVEVRLDEGRRYVRAVYADGRERNLSWIIEDFGASSDEDPRFRAVCLATVVHEGVRSKVLVVSADTPIDDAGSVVIAYSGESEELWRQSLTPSQRIRWRDCYGPDAVWGAGQVCAANLDGQSGDEIIAVGRHRTQHPARVSILDGGTGRIRSTFWNMGIVYALQVIGGYFEDGHAAIVGYGINNKFDEFDELKSGDPVPLTDHNHVNVVFVLDPLNMNGVSPPRGCGMEMVPGIPWAYGLLDAQADRVSRSGADDHPPLDQEPREWFKIDRITWLPGATIGTSEGFLEVSLNNNEEDERGSFWLDRDLYAIGHQAPESDERMETSLDWSGKWIPVIQRGQNVDDPRPISAEGE